MISIANNSHGLPLFEEKEKRRKRTDEERREEKVLRQPMFRAHRNQKGITGLETAIILIAFVVVAAVFAYTALSAGLFSTQKSQEAVYAGLEEAQSTVELSGNVTTAGVGLINDMDAPIGWVSSDGTNTVITRETTAATVYEGNASAKIALTITASQNDYWYYPIPATSIGTSDTITFWVYSSIALDAADDLIFYADTDTTITDSTATFNVGTVSATTWTLVSTSVGAAVTDAIYFGFEYGEIEAANIYIDHITYTTSAGLQYTLTDCDYPVGWTSSDTTNTVASRETTLKNEGTAALKIAAAVTDSADDYWYHSIAAQSFTTSDTISFWIYSSVALDTADDIKFFADTDTTITDSTATFNVGTLSATTWTYVTGNVGAAVTNATYYGFQYGEIEAANIYIDMIQGPVLTASRTKMPDAYADTVSFTLSIVLSGEAINFTPTTDSDNDGLLSDETALHSVIINYNDAYQNVNDLAWTVAKVGKDDGDNLLEANEKFKITIQLRAVNLGADSVNKVNERVGPNHTFTIQIKPHHGAVMTIEKTMNEVVKARNELMS